jgi:zinc D-Ala-D-Ala carboxypeptidase
MINRLFLSVIHFLFVCMLYIPSSYAQILVTNPINKNFLLGRFQPSEHPAFVKIGSSYTPKEQVYLQKPVYDAFIAMYQAARKEGINLQIISATRNFEHQKQIWETKWRRAVRETDRKKRSDAYEQIARGILRYSSMPGSSRHHWGTDIDINSVEPEYFETTQGKRVYQWLKENAADYGFCQPYTSKTTGRTGYEEEPWHWSYAPLSCEYQTAYAEIITYSDITGFEGAEQALRVDLIDDFVLGISPDCFSF